MNDEFYKWFESLTPEEQRKHVEEMEADNIIENYKSGCYDIE